MIVMGVAPPSTGCWWAANFQPCADSLVAIEGPYGVIRAQAPTAVLMLVVNMVLMNVLAFRV